MKKINICIIGKQDAQFLEQKILKLKSKFKLKIDVSYELEKFAEDIKVSKYNILIITNDEINNSRELLFQTLEGITSNNPRIQILLFVNEQNIDLGITSLKAGTYQYVKQPVSNKELRLLIETAVEQQPQIIDEENIENNGLNKYGEIIGGSKSMLQVYDQIQQAAFTDIPVLILGETGTGKDLVSYTIHKTSERADNSYLAVNLGALPTELVGSELFGHEKGAFTGAQQLHKGVFEQGSKGTVFLDEIDSMDGKVQVSLLRLLEQKKFKRLGGTKSLKSKARLIAATNENLDDLVESGIFRTDLFYRLDVFRITLPPLRERIDDIPLLVEEMIIKYSRTYKKNISSISKSSLEALMNFDWPGNVRELKNVIQRAVLVCNGKSVQIKHLPKRFSQPHDTTPKLSLKLGTTLHEAEREMISHALAISKNNKKEAARLLGISRRALYNKLSKHNL